MYNFIIKDKSDNILSNMYVKNYKRAYILSKMIYPINSFQIQKELKLKKCQGCKDIIQPKIKCSCWGF